MKPFHIAIGIAGVALLVVGAIGIRSKLEYDKDEREITRLIGEFKAMGVPTNGDEYFHPIPDSQNAWVEIGPMLLNKNGKGNGPLFRSEVVSDLLAVTTKDDLPLIRKYLVENQSKRTAIAEALKAKPEIQIPHNYNEGIVMLLPEYATMKTVAKEFCLEGYADGLSGNVEGFRRNLDIAMRFANYCTDRGEQIGSLVGTSIRREVMNVALRLAEQSPNLIPQIQAYITNPNLMHVTDPKQVFKCEFVNQIVTGRFFDTPAADRRPPPWPLNKIVKAPDSNELESRGKARSGDYMPNSPAMRTYLRKRLEAWKPFMAELMSPKEVTAIPSKQRFKKAIDLVADLPPALNSYSDMVLSADDLDYTYGSYSLDRRTIDTNLNLWRAIEIKAKTGKFPNSLTETGIPIRSITGKADFVLKSNKDGIIVESVSVIKSTGKPFFRCSYPISLTRDSAYFTSHLKKVQDYRAGKISANGGNAGKATLVIPPPGAPPVAPPTAKISPGP